MSDIGGDSSAAKGGGDGVTAPQTPMSYMSDAQSEDGDACSVMSTDGDPVGAQVRRVRSIPNRDPARFPSFLR